MCITVFALFSFRLFYFYYYCYFYIKKSLKTNVSFLKPCLRMLSFLQPRFIHHYHQFSRTILFDENDLSKLHLLWIKVSINIRHCQLRYILTFYLFLNKWILNCTSTGHWCQTITLVNLLSKCETLMNQKRTSIAKLQMIKILYWTANDHSPKVKDIIWQDLRSLSF